MRKIFVMLVMFLLGSSCAFAADFVEGDILVVIRAPEGVEVTLDFLDSDECREYIENFLAPTDAKLVTLYEGLSWLDGSIHFLAHSDTQTTQEMLEALKDKPELSAASVNQKIRIRTGGRVR